MKMDAYLEVEPGTGLGYDLLPVDGKVEIRIGSSSSWNAGALRLAFSDADTLDRLAQTVIDARTVLMRECSAITRGS